MSQSIHKMWKAVLIVLCVAILLAGVWLGRDTHLIRARYSRMPVLTEETYEELIQTREELEGEEGLTVTLRYREDEVPYDRFTNTFMQTGPMRSAGMTAEIRREQNGAESGGDDVIQFARLPEQDGFVAYTKENYTEYTFWETELPVVVLHTEGEEIGDVNYQDVTLSVYDEAAGQDFCVNMTAGIHTRGASSSWIPKKSYRLKVEAVENHMGNRYGFFGMKPANEWVMMSLYGDESKMREKLARDLWNDIAADSSYADAGTGLELSYYEMYLDDEYIGLYGMGTAVDRKNYWTEKNKDSQDLLFKSINFNVPTEEEIQEADADTEAVQCLELKYASWVSDDMWQTIGTYLNLAYFASDEEYLTQMKEYMNVDNHIDYWLFFLTAGLDDNELKNIYFSITDAKNSKEILMTPWDMDMAWGVGYTGEDIFMWGRNDNQYRKILDFPIVSRMYALKDEEMMERTEARWTYLRKSIITEERLLNDIRRNHAIIWESGIMERERAKWLEAKYADDSEYIENYVQNRLSYLDTYLTTLLHNNRKFAKLNHSDAGKQKTE